MPTTTHGFGRYTRAAGILLACALAACDDGKGDGTGEATGTLTREELMDPQTCKECHADAFRQWASSMHAYAAEDPVFLAMNARGQEETGGALGDFCVNCHAPMAVREGLTDDGRDLDELDDMYKGVTCYFCHNVEGLEAGHKDANNPLVLANDTTMRGALEDPVRPPAHEVAYSALHDGKDPRSAALCGTCHDIKTPAGVHLERTFAEWNGSIFSKGDAPQTCNACHMPGVDGTAAQSDDIDVPSRRVHTHLFAGVDTALTDFPDIEVQRAAIACELSAVVRAALIPNPSGEFIVRLEANAAHRWPSGAAQDRRAWVEFTAYDAGGKVIFESGHIAEGEPVLKTEGATGYDRNLFAMHDSIFDEDGQPVHMFWEAAPSEAHPDGYERFTLPGTTDLNTPHFREWSYRVAPQPARVTVQVHIRPMDLNVIDELIADGHLDAEVRDGFHDVSLASGHLDWTEAEDGWDEYTTPEPNPLDCPNDWRCQLYPDYPGCSAR